MAAPSVVQERRWKLMSKAKKVIFVIVEGPTDEDALSSVLKQIFSSAEVHFHVIHSSR